MKKTTIIGMLLGIAIVPAALANTITGSQTPGAHFLNGGEITAVTTPPVQFGMPGPSGPPSFQTFCIESQVGFNNGGTYLYSLSQTDHAGHPLTIGAAWLFAKFTAGTLAGYDYTFGSGRELSAGGLQLAIWQLQGQTIPSGFLGNATVVADAAIDVGLATAAASLLGHAPKDPSAGMFGVNVLSLTTRDGAPAQDWLGVPDGGTTMALLGFALVAVEGLRRKLSC